MSERHLDRPLPLDHWFHRELAMAWAPRLDPASAPGPPGNGALDDRALATAHRLLEQIVG